MQFSLCISEFESDMASHPSDIATPSRVSGCVGFPAREKPRSFRGLGPVAQVSDAQTAAGWNRTGSF